MTDEYDAIVTATFGSRMQVELADGRTVDARLKGRQLRPVCGDRVTARPLPGESDWLILSIESRRNELTRPNQRGRTEILAANLDFLAVTAAPLPAPDWYVVDRYLSAAELIRIDAAVVFNKADDGRLDAATSGELANYERIGYAIVVCSAHTGHGLDELAATFSGRTAVIVGQSGVGKSTLIGALTGMPQRTAEVSAARREGRHTTVNSVMLTLPGGGRVIDSPGVRDYAPSIDDPAQVESGFREVHAIGRDCRFANCRHRHEPGCAVKSARDDGRMAVRRYESYRRLLNLTEQRLERQPSSRRPRE